MSQYVSSIINNYGDVDNLRQDANTLRDILARQGQHLIFEVVANQHGNVALKFKLNRLERNELIKSTTELLTSLLSERL